MLFFSLPEDMHVKNYSNLSIKERSSTYTKKALFFALVL